MINYFIIIVVVNFLIFKNYRLISKYYNIFDYPDGLRKRHKNPTPLIGGLIFIFNLFIFYLYEYYFSFNLSFFNIKIEIIYFLITSFLFFLIGYIDDRFQLNPNLKLLTFTILILILIIFDKELIIQDVIFTFDMNFSFSYFGYFFTILCFLLFINAFNMLDGINGQAGGYSIFISIAFIFNAINTIFFILLIIITTIFLIYNFKNKMFLGDSGTLLIGFIFSYFFVKSYNIGNNIYPDEIVLIMLIPGYELLRLAIQRIIKKKHPFRPDENHIHHLILKHSNFLKTYLIVQILLVFPYLSYLIIKSTIVSLIISTALYSLIVVYYKNKKIKASN